MTLSISNRRDLIACGSHSVSIPVMRRNSSNLQQLRKRASPNACAFSKANSNGKTANWTSCKKRSRNSN